MKRFHQYLTILILYLQNCVASNILIHTVMMFNTSTSITPEYEALRSRMIEEDQKLLLGASILLSDPREEKVNDILMSFKRKEFQNGVASQGRLFPAARPFYNAKADIEKSDVFNIIRMLPKGGNLHLHLNQAVNVSFILNNLTKCEFLYYCERNNDPESFVFLFSDIPPEGECTPGSDWNKMASNDQSIKDRIRLSLTMQEPRTYPDSKAAWIKFDNSIHAFTSLMQYIDVLKEGFYHVLLDHYKDNVMYAEFRLWLNNIYYLNQTRLSPNEVLDVLQKVLLKFLDDFPDFGGAKIIQGQYRFSEVDRIREFLEDAVELKKLFPTFYAGFDLDGQEDKNAPLSKFSHELLMAKDRGLNFFFHAGETNWGGTEIDENLVDAILLNTTRLGHAFSLYRHPHLYGTVKTRQIGVELCPISNQVLRHVDDLRLHPGVTFLRDGFPVVINSDDPAAWGTLPLSHDWYVAFMAMAGQHADLRFLKQLALNAIKYSAMNAEETDAYTKKWEAKWNMFLDNVIEIYS